MTLPTAEMSVLKELEEILQASGSLKRRETIPVQLQNQSDRSSHDIGVLVENHAVIVTRLCSLLIAGKKQVDSIIGSKHNEEFLGIREEPSRGKDLMGKAKA